VRRRWIDEQALWDRVSSCPGRARKAGGQDALISSRCAVLLAASVRPPYLTLSHGASPR